MTDRLTRRDFLAIAGSAVAVGCMSGGASSAGAASAQASGRGSAPMTVLFQGDSITDGFRNRTDTKPNSAPALGGGYPLLVTSQVMEAHPDRALRFFNRGISGNKVPDLQARWAADTLALAPDLLSVLVGVNDFWHKRLNGYPGTVSDYENQFVALLEETRRRALPKVRLLVLEPFVLRTGAVDASWFPEFDERRAAAARVAQRTGARFVPLQDAFSDAAKSTGPAYWAADGVHPTPAGHELIAERWRAAAGL